MNWVDALDGLFRRVDPWYRRAAELEDGRFDPGTVHDPEGVRAEPVGER